MSLRLIAGFGFVEHGYAELSTIHWRFARHTHAVRGGAALGHRGRGDLRRTTSRRARPERC